MFQLIISLNAQERKENEYYLLNFVKLTFTPPQKVKFNLIILAIILLIRTSSEQLRNYLRANVTNGQTFGGNRSKINSAHILIACLQAVTG